MSHKQNPNGPTRDARLGAVSGIRLYLELPTNLVCPKAQERGPKALVSSV